MATLQDESKRNAKDLPSSILEEKNTGKNV